KSWMAQILAYVEQDALAKDTDAKANGAPPPQKDNTYGNPVWDNWYPWDSSQRYIALNTPLKVFQCASDSRQYQASYSEGISVAFTGYLGVSGTDTFGWSVAPSKSFYKK